MLKLFDIENTTLYKIRLKFKSNYKDIAYDSLFCFDTGCSISVINLLTFSTLSNVYNNLKFDGYIYVTFADGMNKVKKSIYIIPELYIDGICIINKRFILGDDYSPNLLGNDILKCFNYFVDNKKHEIKIVEVLSEMNCINSKVVNFDKMIDKVGHVYSINTDK